MSVSLSGSLGVETMKILLKSCIEAMLVADKVLDASK